MMLIARHQAAKATSVAGGFPRSDLGPRGGVKTSGLDSAGVAQLVEQRIRNAWVGGSSPFTGTISSNIDETEVVAAALTCA